MSWLEFPIHEEAGGAVEMVGLAVKIAMSRKLAGETHG